MDQRPSGGATPPPICDVHAHYLSPAVLDRLDGGAVPVRLETIDGTVGAITARGMPVGSTIDQLASVEGIRDGMRAEGLERRVLSPPPFTFRYWEDPRPGVELCRALNDSLAEVVAGQDDLVGLATVPLQDTDAAIAELERATRDLGLVGVEVGTYVGDGNLADRRLEPFFAAVEEAALPVLIHPDFRSNLRWSDFYLINLLGMPVESAIALSNLVFAGTLDRHPELRLCFVHGGGVAPYLYGRWDTGWRVRTETKSLIHRPPSDYLRLVYCDTLTHSVEALAFLIRVAGPERVVLGTDSPFDVRDPDTRGQLARVPDLEPAQLDQIERYSPLTWLLGELAPVPEVAR
jgi:aminocarboxymuconate-semialdehyde decarboxylase